MRSWTARSRGSSPSMTRGTAGSWRRAPRWCARASTPAAGPGRRTTGQKPGSSPFPKTPCVNGKVRPIAADWLNDSSVSSIRISRDGARALIVSSKRRGVDGEHQRHPAGQRRHAAWLRPSDAPVPLGPRDQGRLGLGFQHHRRRHPIRPNGSRRSGSTSGASPRSSSRCWAWSGFPRARANGARSSPKPRTSSTRASETPGTRWRSRRATSPTPDSGRTPPDPPLPRDRYPQSRGRRTRGVLRVPCWGT